MKITDQQVINAFINLKKFELGIERMDAAITTLFYLNNKLEELNNNIYVDEVCKIVDSTMVRLHSDKINMQASCLIAKYLLSKELMKEENADILGDMNF